MSMLLSNTLRYCTDVFGDLDADSTDDENITSTFLKSAQLESTVAWNCSGVLSVNGFKLTTIAPENSDMRFLFKLDDDKYYRLDGEGKKVLFDQDLTAANIIKGGNSAAELAKLVSVPDFVGRKIRPVILLRASNEAADMPAVKIALKVTAPNNKLTYTTDESEMPIWELAIDDNLPRIISIVPDISCTGSGEVSIQIRLRDEFDNWSAYMPLEEAAEKDAAALQFKIVYKVGEVGDVARINSIAVSHTFGKMIVSGEDADLYTLVQDFSVPLQMCHVTVRHSPLIDSKIAAYVNFMHPKKTRTLINIGAGNGKFAEYVLGVGGVKDTNIDASSIQIFATSSTKYIPVNNFSYNSETSTVALSAKSGVQLFASYDYDHDSEKWRKMSLDVTEPYNSDTGDCMTRFTYSLPDQDATNKTITNIRLVIKRPTGKVSNFDLGAATSNAKQLFKLDHAAVPSSIKFTSDQVDFSLDEDSDLLVVVAPKGTPRIISYSWRGENITIYSLACGWSVA